MRVRSLSGGVIVLACASLAFTGCAAIPETPATQKARDTRDFAVERSFKAPAAQWPAQDWWGAYGDPQLNVLIAEALRDSPTLASAQARILKAQSLAQQANAALLPSLSANGSVQKYKQSYNNGIPPELVPRGYNNSARTTLDFSYEYDFSGAIARHLRPLRPMRTQLRPTQLLRGSPFQRRLRQRTPTWRNSMPIGTRWPML